MRRAWTSARGSGKMVRVGVRPHAQHLGVDPRAAPQGVAQLLQHQGAGPVRIHETRAVCIEWPRGELRLSWYSGLTTTALMMTEAWMSPGDMSKSPPAITAVSDSPLMMSPHALAEGEVAARARPADGERRAVEPEDLGDDRGHVRV